MDNTSGPGAHMFVPTPGALFLDRFHIETPLPTHARETSRWAAHDILLGKQREIFFVSGPRAPRVADAARRALLVNDPRIVSIIDIGRAGPLAYILTDITQGIALEKYFPMRPAMARALVGEAAAALESAQRLGVHHGTLTPDMITVTDNRDIHIAGLAWQAVVGVEDSTPLWHGMSDNEDSSSRHDAVSLVGLMYAALTGRWPGEESPFLTSAPQQADGTPVPPAVLVNNVPGDLDTLCSVTFGPNHDGPHSPREIVRELAPWEPPDFTLARPPRFVASTRENASSTATKPAAANPRSSENAAIGGQRSLAGAPTIAVPTAPRGKVTGFRRPPMWRRVPPEAPQKIIPPTTPEPPRLLPVPGPNKSSKAFLVALVLVLIAVIIGLGFMFSTGVLGALGSFHDLPEINSLPPLLT